MPPLSVEPLTCCKITKPFDSINFPDCFDNLVVPITTPIPSTTTYTLAYDDEDQPQPNYDNDDNDGIPNIGVSKYGLHGYPRWPYKYHYNYGLHRHDRDSNYPYPFAGHGNRYYHGSRHRRQPPNYRVNKPRNVR